MVSSMPFIINRLFNSKSGNNEKLWMLAGLVAACIGVAICGSRAPIVAGVMIIIVAWIFSGFSVRVGMPIVVGFVAVTALIFSNERFQRITSLAEQNVVAHRFKGSVNETFFGLLFEYPFGAGMGSSVGTSIPYFLQTRAPKPIGLESEYSRILIDQGWIGLLLWLLFIFWLHVPWPRTQGSRSAFHFGTIMIYAGSLTTWATATLGAGVLSAVPGSAILLINMGIIVARREEFSAMRRMPARRRPPSTQRSWQSDL